MFLTCLFWALSVPFFQRSRIRRLPLCSVSSDIFVDGGWVDPAGCAFVLCTEWPAKMRGLSRTCVGLSCPKQLQFICIDDCPNIKNIFQTHLKYINYCLNLITIIWTFWSVTTMTCLCYKCSTVKFHVKLFWAFKSRHEKPDFFLFDFNPPCNNDWWWAIPSNITIHRIDSQSKKTFSTL